MYLNISFLAEQDSLIRLQSQLIKTLLQQTPAQSKPEKRFLCDHCPKSFSSNFAVKEHTKTVHEGLKYTCDTCNKTFLTKSGLRNCQDGHIGNKKHVCEICDQGFVYKTDLQNHMPKHTGNWPTCPKCQQQFRSVSNYSRHVKTCGENLEKIFVCRHCPKKFATKEYRKKHENCTHLNPKSYVCPKCSFAYSHSTSLRKHLKTCSS